MNSRFVLTVINPGTPLVIRIALAQTIRAGQSQRREALIRWCTSLIVAQQSALNNQQSLVRSRFGERDTHRWMNRNPMTSAMSTNRIHSDMRDLVKTCIALNRSYMLDCKWESCPEWWLLKKKKKKNNTEIKEFDYQCWITFLAENHAKDDSDNHQNQNDANDDHANDDISLFCRCGRESVRLKELVLDVARSKRRRTLLRFGFHDDRSENWLVSISGMEFSLGIVRICTEFRNWIFLADTRGSGMSGDQRRARVNELFSSPTSKKMFLTNNNENEQWCHRREERILFSQSNE